MFSCKFCEIFKNTFFKEHLRKTTSGKVGLEQTHIDRFQLNTIYSSRHGWIHSDLELVFCAIVFGITSCDNLITLWQFTHSHRSIFLVPTIAPMCEDKVPIIQCKNIFGNTQDKIIVSCQMYFEENLRWPENMRLWWWAYYFVIVTEIKKIVKQLDLMLYVYCSFPLLICDGLK